MRHHRKQRQIVRKHRLVYAVVRIVLRQFRRRFYRRKQLAFAVGRKQVNAVRRADAERFVVRVIEPPCVCRQCCQIRRHIQRHHRVVFVDRKRLPLHAAAGVHVGFGGRAAKDDRPRPQIRRHNGKNADIAAPQQHRACRNRQVVQIRRPGGNPRKKQQALRFGIVNSPIGGLRQPRKRVQGTACPLRLIVKLLQHRRTALFLVKPHSAAEIKIAFLGRQMHLPHRQVKACVRPAPAGKHLAVDKAVIRQNIPADKVPQAPPDGKSPVFAKRRINMPRRITAVNQHRLPVKGGAGTVRF